MDDRKRLTCAIINREINLKRDYVTGLRNYL